MMTAQQLKNSILQRAIEGKLVEQRPEEGTAKELLKEIKLEKEKLVKEGKIKKSKPLPDITEDEIPFEIPASWEWVRLGDIFLRDMGGGTPSKSNPKYWNGDVPWMSVKDFSNAHNGLLKETVDHITLEGVNNSSTNIIDTSAVVLCVRMGLGRYAKLAKPTAINQDLRAFWISQNIVEEYFLRYYSAIKINGTGTTVKGIKREELLLLLFPLPPLSEQQRIVAKIEELMPLVEQYGKAYSQLTALNEKFPQDMKKSILQYAIEGKLVEQRPEEGTAKELLKEIKLEKEKLVKEGKIKKSKPLPAISEDEIPFEIPESWEWVRLGEITINRDNERVPLSVSQRENLDKIYDYYGASGVIDKVDDYLFDGELLLIGEDGANLLMRSKPIAFIAKGKFWVNNHAHVIDVYKSIYMLYIMHYINTINVSPYVTGTAQPKMNQAKMNSIPVPLPPLSEQHRIVERLDQLLPLCDKLMMEQ